MALERRRLLEEATRRLEANKDLKARRGISDFVKANSLADDVELAMRMLDSEMVAELLAGREDLEWKLAEVAGQRAQSALVLKLISQLDPDVEALVQNLRAEDSGPAAKGKTAAGLKGAAKAAAVTGKRSSGEATDDNEKLMAEALRRVDAVKTPLAKSSIDRFVKEWEFGEEVQLGLMLLQPIHLREFFAGEKDIIQKLGGVPEPAKLAIQIITMLDPKVPSLSAALQSQDSPKPPATPPPAKRAKASPAVGVPKQPATPPPKAKAALTTAKAQPPGRPVKAALTTAKAKPPAKALTTAKAKGALAKLEPDQLVFQAEMRLRMNKTAQGEVLIKNFAKIHGLGEECVLALRMLGKDMLQEFMAGRGPIGKKLAEVADKSAMVLTLVSGLDAEAVELVQALVKADGAGAQEPEQPEEEEEEENPYSNHPLV